MDNLKIVTIGVYGFDEAGFFNTLKSANVDTLLDIRRRRGVRGSLYAFANSIRLQQELARINIRYIYLPELAPTQDIRNIQKQADQLTGTSKRKRYQLDPTFIEQYQSKILANYEFDKLFRELAPSARVIALFCVEREHEACHRSIVAERLKQKYQFSVEHLLPWTFSS